MISISDLDNCFSTDDFAVAGTFTLTNGTKVVTSGYLDTPTGEAGIGDINVEAVHPTFTAPTSAVAGVTRGAALEAEGTDFTVVFVRHAGNGISVCYLK